MVFDRAVPYPLPVIVVDNEEFSRTLYPGAHVSIFIQAVKVDGRTQIKDAAMVTIEGTSLLTQQRYDEAAARLYIAYLLDPRLVHLKFLLLMSQFTRDCAPPTNSSFLPPSAYASYHQITTSTSATKIRATANATETDIADTDAEISQTGGQYGYGCANDEGSNKNSTTAFTNILLGGFNYLPSDAFKILPPHQILGFQELLKGMLEGTGIHPDHLPQQVGVAVETNGDQSLKADSGSNHSVPSMIDTIKTDAQKSAKDRDAPLEMIYRNGLSRSKATTKKLRVVVFG